MDASKWTHNELYSMILYDIFRDNFLTNIHWPSLVNETEATDDDPTKSEKKDNLIFRVKQGIAKNGQMDARVSIQRK